MFRALFFVLSALLLIVIARAEEEESADVNKKKEELAALRKKAETGGDNEWHSFAKALIEDEQFDESRVWLRRAAEKGHVEAAFLLGEAYREGEGVTKDEVEALRWVRFAAEKGLPDAMACYGLMLYYGQGMRPDKELSAEWLRKGADNGNVFCMYMLSMLRKDTDPALSFKYSLKGAHEGNALCMVIAAEHYANGTGTGRDPVEAGIWAHIANHQDGELQHPAMEVLRMIGPADAVKALICVEARITRHRIEINESRRAEIKEQQERFMALAQKANEGDKDAAVEHAASMINGQGCVPDVKEGARRLLKLAETGFAKACGKVADFHMTGRGFPDDKARALAWYKKAHAMGHAKSAMTVAIGLSNGWFGEKNETEAERWLKLSADAGHGPAQLRLAEKHLYEENYAEMLRWYRKAAQNGEQSALVGLFQAHLRGRGVRINVGEAAGYALATMRVGTIKDEDEEREVLRFVMRMDEKYEAAAQAACERIINHEFAISNR